MFLGKKTFYKFVALEIWMGVGVRAYHDFSTKSAEFGSKNLVNLVNLKEAEVYS